MAASPAARSFRPRCPSSPRASTSVAGAWLPDYAAREMRILFVSSNRVCDAVLSTGLLDHLLRQHPDARFTVACGPAAEGVFARMPNRERTILLDKRSYSLHWLPLWAATARRRWDLVVDIRGSALSWMVLTQRRAVMR